MVKSADRALQARECGHIAERHARLADIHSEEVVDFRNEEQNLRVAMHRLRSEIEFTANKAMHSVQESQLFSELRFVEEESGMLRAEHGQVVRDTVQMREYEDLLKTEYEELQSRHEMTLSVLHEKREPARHRDSNRLRVAGGKC